MNALGLIATTAGAVLVLAVVLHVWYAMGLSRVFAARGAEPWRAWVPIVNDAEVFRLGRVDPVRAVLLLVPFVNVYALVLKATAAHRLGAASGRGAGTTALALVLPPVWAGILAAPGATPDAAKPHDANDPAVDEAAVDDAEEPSSGPLTAVPGAGTPAAAAGTRRASRSVEVPAAVPVLAGPVDVPPRGASVLTTTPEVGSSVPVAPPSGSAVHGDDSGPAEHDDVAPVSAAPVAPTAESGLGGIDAADGPAAADTGAPFDRVAETTDATASAADRAEMPVAAPLDESTQTARPRSRRRGEWILGLPDGEQVSITGRTVVLGRKPAQTEESVQYIAVADDTRTMSKQHARLDWTVTGWTITDLDSTNGVTLLHDDGRSERLRAQTPALASERLRLGDAQIDLRPGAIA
ncbi:FHA domain-containing protein [Microbacterium sp. CFBP 13617]|uniref:DUF5684 domain-containing protein n=1 Tax=Microbacterium sp. CFBP 13617 TaxID=2774035 RepID=UPI001785F97C|nr:DUF5684 domain-containing protein [Microbacterium sp. CFBP 13617]MBD8217048.1 FHA domain-containing protein [Microbacterium sp. CFBP 13617]